MTALLPHTGPRKRLFGKAAGWLHQVDILLDVGAGIRPQALVPCSRHICAEPHGEYADVLAAHGFEVIRARATEALARIDRVDTIVALDVIEHMERDEGEAFIKAAVAKARHQVVIFTPLGFMPQDGGDAADPWGLQGQHWQAHRSGWTPADFPGWRCLIGKDFHKKHNHGAFFAIHTRKT
jgi:hypothetical protein